MKYNFILSYEDGVQIILFFDYKIVIEGRNKGTIVINDLIDINIYELIQITV